MSLGLGQQVSNFSFCFLVILVFQAAQQRRGTDTIQLTTFQALRNP